ncbi:MAG: PBECR4 domain-containing protein [Oscillospiraceae bacterium]
MNTQNDRSIIVSEIIKSAKAYKQNLVGKTFLYVFDNNHIEVMFKAKDFKHLTGVDTSLSAQEFFRKAYKGELQSTQIFFSARHPYHLVQRKLKHLQAISSLAMGESLMLKDIKTNTEIYKYGTTDLQFSLCFNKERDANGIEQGNCFIAKSLRDEDCFSKSNDVFTITHIYSKRNDEKKYSQELYCEQGYSTDDLLPEIKEMLSEELLREPKQADISSISETKNGTMQLSTIEYSSIPMNLSVQGGAVALSPTVPPNDIFTKMANALVKGLDKVVHKASLGIEKINRAATNATNSLFASKTHTEAHRASQSKSKGNSPKKTKAAESTRSVAPVKRSVHEQEERPSVVGQIKEINAEQAFAQASKPPQKKSMDIDK